MHSVRTIMCNCVSGRRRRCIKVVAVLNPFSVSQTQYGIIIVMHFELRFTILYLIPRTKRSPVIDRSIGENERTTKSGLTRLNCAEGINNKRKCN